MTSDRTTLILGVALVVVAVLAVIAVAFTPSSAVARLEAIEADLDSLRAAELDHLDAFGYAVPAGWAPRASGSLDAEPVPWSPSEGFRMLAWAPTDREAVYASYAVTVADGDFVATARCDLDGDGVYAEFRATSQSGVSRQTPAAVR